MKSVMEHEGGPRLPRVPRRGVRMIATAGALGGAVLALTAAGAFAVGGSCSASPENVSLTGPDGTRVRAVCSALQADSMARGSLNLVWAFDKHTPWFTARYVIYRSAYDLGPNSGTYYTIAHV